MMSINWDSKSLEEKFIGYLLRMPLDGVLKVPKNKDYIFFYANFFNANNYFKMEGFSLGVDVKKRIVKKLSYFVRNKEFVLKHNLYLMGSGANNLRYSKYMKYRILQYREDHATFKLQKGIDEKEHIRRN